MEQSVTIQERRAGYLANLLNVPPLIFRFQFNPETITDKKSFGYQDANAFGEWGFDKKTAATGFLKTLAGFSTDVKEIGALLTATKPLEARGGEQRSISLEFQLDARRAGPKDGDRHYKGSIEPDLAVLRSFMYPAMDLFDLAKIIGSGFKDLPCWTKPPECSLTFGGISLSCVMADLSIRITDFSSKGEPRRAEVSATLREQTHSISHVIDFLKRSVHAARAPFRENWDEDLKVTSGLQGITDLFD